MGKAKTPLIFIAVVALLVFVGILTWVGLLVATRAPVRVTQSKPPPPVLVGPEVWIGGTDGLYHHISCPDLPRARRELKPVALLENVGYKKCPKCKAKPYIDPQIAAEAEQWQREQEEAEQAASDAWAKEFDEKLAAWIMSKKFVEKRLVSPSTADWPWGGPDGYQKVNANEFRVSGHLDAKNKFNALVRIEYLCHLRHNGRNWTCVSLDIIER